MPVRDLFTFSSDTLRRWSYRDADQVSELGTRCPDCHTDDICFSCINQSFTNPSIPAHIICFARLGKALSELCLLCPLQTFGVPVAKAKGGANTKPAQVAQSEE